MVLKAVQSGFLLLLLGLSSHLAGAQARVATYAYGKPGTATYERLSFWTDKGQRTDIFYLFGTANKEFKLSYAGKVAPATSAGFRLKFSNGHLLSIVPEDNILRVTDDKGTAAKRFAWEYEGPINGIGAFCRECAEDEKEAMSLLRTYYLK